MTHEDALHFHVREFDRQVDDLRSIMLQPDYDNGESPEVVRLRRDILQIVTQTFLLKQTHTRAADFKARNTKGCGDCDPCLGGRPDQCAVGHP